MTLCTSARRKASNFGRLPNVHSHVLKAWRRIITTVLVALFHVNRGNFYTLRCLKHKIGEMKIAGLKGQRMIALVLCTMEMLVTIMRVNKIEETQIRVFILMRNEMRNQCRKFGQLQQIGLSKQEPKQNYGYNAFAHSTNIPQFAEYVAQAQQFVGPKRKRPSRLRWPLHCIFL